MVANATIRPQPSKSEYDLDLEQRLVNFLHARHVPGSESLQLEVHGGTVVVSGPLDSARAKWLCIECCRHVAGVIKLIDQVVVARPGRVPSPPRAAASAARAVNSPPRT